MRAFSSVSTQAHRLPACTRARRSRRAVQACASPQIDRRDVFLSVCGAALATTTPAFAELTTLYGLATPPTSYGGYGGNLNEAPKYKFDYPDTWKQLTVNKVQKVSPSTQLACKWPIAPQSTLVNPPQPGFSLSPHAV